MSENEIKLQRNNDKRTDSDLEWLEEFYTFLQGKAPKDVSIGRGRQPKLSVKKAFAIIWYLQEHFPVFPDHIEQCSNCKRLFDDWSEGCYWETKGKHFCDACLYLVPENYDRGKR